MSKLHWPLPKYPLRVFVLENEDLNSTGFSRTMGQLPTLEWQHVATPVSAPPPELKAETRLRKDTMHVTCDEGPLSFKEENQRASIENKTCHFQICVIARLAHHHRKNSVGSTVTTNSL